MAQQYLSWLRPTRWAPLFVAALLAACGGGGGDNAPRTPESTGDVTPQTANQSSIDVRYGVMETYQGSADNITHELKVVDTVSGAVVWQMTFAPSLNSNPRWLLSDSRQYGGDGRDFQYRGPQLIYFVRDGQVFQMDIGGSVTPQPERISSIDNACGLMGQDIHRVELDGRHDWFGVHIAGPDNDCTNTADDQLVLVSSSMPTNEVGPRQDHEHPLFLSRLPNAQGQALGMLTLDTASRRLVLRSTDLRQVLHTFPDDIDPDLNLFSMALLPGKDTQGLIKIGRDIRLLDSSGTTPILGPTVLTLTNAAQFLLFAKDDKLIYLADGLRILTINGSGAVSTLATLPDNGTEAISLALTGSKVLALQATPFYRAPTSTDSATLWSIQKSTGARIALVQGPDRYDGMVIAIRDNTAFYLRNPSSGTPDLYKVRDNGQGGELVSSAIHWVSAISHPVITANSVAQQSLVWCEALPGQTDCGGGTVVSYDLGSLTKTTLGILPANGALLSEPYGNFEGWAGAQNLLMNQQLHLPNAAETTERYDTTLWLFNAGSANSLRPVQPLL